ncbi:MAG TPA: MBL fold metallo-hydrolase [Candidatus Limnocylindria bacterium]|jgi:Cft2 family RNA processing exonuclease|nr:MBL fold metallo-hydrolase [Candidatus Limnocylindria bacterium]
MRVTNLNPDDAIGASAWYVNTGEHGILLDAGTHPKREGLDALPTYRLLESEHVDAIAVSHCHHDHLGSLPVALRYFPQARVYMTESSYLVAERVLHNSVNVMMRQREEKGIKEYPLYTHEDVEDYDPVMEGIPYRKKVYWSGHGPSDRKGPSLEFHDAGHVLGSAGVMIDTPGQTLFYSGDVCFHDQTIQKGAQYNGIRCDTLILETTRGDAETKPGFSRASELGRLADAIEKVLARKGCVLIPAFALGRTQEMLAMLALMMREGRLKDQIVYVGGLGKVFTELYDVESLRANRNHRDLKLTEALDLQVATKEIPRMSLGSGKIFVLTSGMLNENTASHDMAVRLLPEARHGIFFVGYTDPDSPGGRLRGSKLGEPFILSADAGKCTRRCDVDHFDLTAHALREDLLEFAVATGAKTVILGHGDPAARQWFVGQLKNRCPNVKVVSPLPGETVQA